MSFSKSVVDQVWLKGSTFSGEDPRIKRKDICGAIIARAAYGNTNSNFGWEIDHIIPNDNDNLSNLQPLHWENNRSKADGPNNPNSFCVIP